MAERTEVISNIGATLSVSTSIPATYDASGYGASTITWTVVGEVTDFGEEGVTTASADHTPVATGVSMPIAGAKKYSPMALTIGYIPANAGQDILEAAANATPNTVISAKITNPDASIHYMDVWVSKYVITGGAAGAVSNIQTQLEVRRKPVIVAQS